MQEDGRRDYEVVETGVLIVGAGAAGLRAAIALKQNGVEDVLVLGKRKHGDAHTIWSAGGVNAALGNRDPEDRWDLHAADTLGEGHFICDPGAVVTLTQQAPDRIKELHEWGCAFTLTDEGKIEQRFFGAQRYRRACFVGDRTGEAILETLVGKAKEEGVPYREDVYVTKLLSNGEGRVVGAVGYDMHTGEYSVFEARAVVLAAGGYTSVYSRGSSRGDENTGDAVALAYEAGAALKDMEFTQFHPTGMSGYGDIDGKLVTEAVRGESGRLFNCDGDRFMENYSPENMELDARDVVARANYWEIQAGRGTDDDAVLLDVTHLEPDYIKERLPSMYEMFMEQGVDITKESMKVAPTAHYAMGGVKVDFATMQTDVDGLYALGEATSGVHGANRLGGNSLAETVVFGKILGEHLAENLEGMPLPSLDEEAVRKHLAEMDELAQDGASGAGDNDPQDLITELRDLAWAHAGISRSGDNVREGLRKLEDLKERARSLDVGGGIEDRKLEFALNLRAMLVVLEAILRGALTREESRGAHYREDFFEERPEWEVNVIYKKGEDGEMELSTAPVGEIPQEIRDALEEDYDLTYHLLE